MRKDTTEGIRESRPSFEGLEEAARERFGAGCRIYYNIGFPGTSNINYNAGEPAFANGAVVTLTDDPALQLSATVGMAGAGNTVHFVLDATGYFR